MPRYVIKYFHPGLSIGLQDVRNAWLLLPGGEPVKLKTIIHQGNLGYRLPGSGRRISYRGIKKKLVKKQIIITEKDYRLPF
jgi:hypothetical protein